MAAGQPPLLVDRASSSNLDLTPQSNFPPLPFKAITQPIASVQQIPSPITIHTKYADLLKSKESNTITKPIEMKAVNIVDGYPVVRWTEAEVT
ncbi:hypothetical protein KY285_030364 [Solanum tuberosum]|nr:hypothetical protein KY289_030488 [Solanum tuberosum]KAH0655482.1 hypothetical protein KY285_030364 [Solanum tuberosum]